MDLSSEFAKPIPRQASLPSESSVDLYPSRRMSLPLRRAPGPLSHAGVKFWTRRNLSRVEWGRRIGSGPAASETE